MAAGTGERFGDGEVKQFALLHGRPMLVWSIERFANHDRVDAVTVVVTPGHEERVRKMVVEYSIGKFAGVVAGGGTRQQSVRQGVEAVADECDNILVHDAARPCVSVALIGEMVDTLEQHGAVVPALAAVDTLVYERDGQLDAILDRSGISGVQTPQGFDTRLLLKAHLADVLSVVPAKLRPLIQRVFVLDYF